MLNSILVVGVGSIGKRHISNFNKYFKKIDIADTRSDRLKDVSKLYKIRNSYKSYIDALKNHNDYSAVIICTPPHLHLDIAKEAVKKNINLFIEKPLSINSKGWKELNSKIINKKLINYVAFCHRHIKYTQKLKSLLDKKIIGKIININLRWGSYLPDWHPYEDYRSFYMAKKNHGGGALLDESHGIDLVRYLFGEVDSVFAKVGNFSDLEISSDDNAYLTLIFKEKIIGHLNFDLVARHPRIYLEINGSEGIIIWDRVEHTIKIFEIKKNKWKTLNFSKEEFMEMYPRQAKHFINCLKGKEKEKIDITDALKTQNLIDTSFSSSKYEKLLKIK